MPKPGRRSTSPADEMARFTDREDQQAVFHRLLLVAEEPPVLVFYGTGGTGKTWLLNILRKQVPDGIPLAYLDFDVTANGQRFSNDSGFALRSIQQHLAKDTPRFNMALSMLRHRQGITEEPGLFIDVAADVASSFIPAGGVVLRYLSKRIISRLEGTPLEKLLDNARGTQLVIELRGKKAQEIENELLYYLADDLREAFPPHLSRAVSCVIFLDTFEALGASFQNEDHRREHEKWIQNMAAEFDFALIVIAGQNRLNWDEADRNWADKLEQHLVGGLAESDARQFLAHCAIENVPLQDSILSTSRESSQGYHCLSLGLCADIVVADRSSGREPAADTLRFSPQDWDKLAHRFLKSLPSNEERRWIEKLALTPRFDEAAAREAFSSGKSSAQDVAWESLHNYSFVEHLSDIDCSAVRSQMRSALEHQPSAQARLIQDHEWWKNYWADRSKSALDDAASLSWYHYYYLARAEAVKTWKELARSARTAVPPRMREHFGLLSWLEPLGLFEKSSASGEAALAFNYLGAELYSASLGNRSSNLQKAVACYESALRVYTEQGFPQNWALLQNNLGITWEEMPTGDRAANIEKAVACYESALRVYTEQGFPQNWALLQNNLGNAWWKMPTGDRAANIGKAIACFEAALRVRTEQEFPQGWATTQTNMGSALSDMPTDRAANTAKAIACHEAALHVYTEEKFPHRWATVQHSLGGDWWGMPTGDRAANIEKAIACYESALRVYTEQEFPEDWARTKDNLGMMWQELPTGDRKENLEKSIACYEAALRVYTEAAFPREHKLVGENLRSARADLLASQNRG